MKRMKFVVLMLIVCMTMSAFLTSCGGKGGSSESKEGGDSSTLVIAVQDEIEGCDVQKIGWTNMVHELLYEPLVVFNSDLTEIQPSAAESYKVTDDYIEFTLPEDMSWMPPN